MMGLAILFGLAVYLLISAVVIWAARRWARRNGRDPRRWGWGAALVMYLIPFWDLIPTLVMHQYRCATEAGFWVYKTPEQWVAENPGVLETLSVSHLPEQYYKGLPPGTPSNSTIIDRHYVLPDGTELVAQFRSNGELMYVDLRSPDGAWGFQINERIQWVIRQTGPHLVNLWRQEETVVDSGSKQVLARYVDFRAGYGNWLESGTRHGLQGAKFWLQNDHCNKGSLNASKLRGVMNALRGAK
jgi:hypothetical protein